MTTDDLYILKQRTPLSKYKVEQFPKNKDIFGLSDEQKQIRKGKKKYTYEAEFTCVKCGKKQAISEFYIRDKNTGRRNKGCRDCQMKAANVIEIGKFRFAKKILGKGFRRCSVCKEIKPIMEFGKSDKSFGGHFHNCKDCNYKLSQTFIKSQREKIGLFYIKQYGKQKYGYVKFNKRIIDKLKSEILENRKPKFFVDGFEFVTVADFGRYIEDKYGVKAETVERRILVGRTEDECKLSESDMRSLAYTMGKIVVTDTVTGQIFEFKNSSDKGLTEMFSSSAIDHAIKTGKKTRITSLSKYKNP